jgi:two-component system, NarL family, nitrate/nitrite response regulator NarL
MVSETPYTGIQNTAEDGTSKRSDIIAALTASRDPRAPSQPPNNAATTWTERSNIPARILVAGDDLLAGALASALEVYGFATKRITPRELEARGDVQWHPSLVILDVRSLEIASGTALIDQMCRAHLRVCVIDSAGDPGRLNAWMRAGVSALIDGGEPLEQLFRTITRLLRRGSSEPTSWRMSSSLELARAADKPQDLGMQNFAVLTERERVVLAELMEGHCADEIATAGFVSISTVRSQIKAILQKLGVNSQLAAVALARRAGWSLDASRSEVSPIRQPARQGSLASRAADR